MLERLVHERGRRFRLCPKRLLRQFEVESDVDKPLLRPVVQVSLDLSASRVRGGNDARPRPVRYTAAPALSPSNFQRLPTSNASRSLPQLPTTVQYPPGSKRSIDPVSAPRSGPTSSATFTKTSSGEHSLATTVAAPVTRGVLDQVIDVRQIFERPFDASQF
jgi:hypothetical protein